MVSPIFVVGVPRSGTSLVTGILAACGAWTGETFGPSPWNPKGNFENRLLKDELVKPWLLMVGADPLGLGALPSLDRAASVVLPGDYWRSMAHNRLIRQGWDGKQIWAFKDCKTALQWAQWAVAFPDARWLIVTRDRDEIIKSCLRAEPMLRRRGPDYDTWGKWVDSYVAHLDCIPSPLEINTQRDVLDSTDGIKALVEQLGLTWRPSVVDAFISMDLWGGKL